MIISAIRESGNETRVAITPNVIKHYLKLGLEIRCEHNAGKMAGFEDEVFQEAGAVIIKDYKVMLQTTKILVCISEPNVKDISSLPADSLLIGPIDNNSHSELLAFCLKNRISVFSMNYVPRISRAQNIDSLSSQANLGGYRAVLEATSHFKRAIPMMMTAAGMIQPAKVLILGAGVAGLQAIATAKRLGAIVYAFDVRAAAKEQVESLGAQFIEVSQQTDAETAGGYAGEVSDEYKRLQTELIDQYARASDLVICTALIPGKKAPVLIKQKTVEQMKPGSVIVDMAAARGGNCELSENDATLVHKGVTIIGNSNLAGLVPATASELYANNVVNLVRILAAIPDKLIFNEEDDIIRAGLLCHDGQLLPYQLIKEQ